MVELTYQQIRQISDSGGGRPGSRRETRFTSGVKSRMWRWGPAPSPHPPPQRCRLRHTLAVPSFRFRRCLVTRRGWVSGSVFLPPLAAAWCPPWATLGRLQSSAGVGPPHPLTPPPVHPTPGTGVLPSAGPGPGLVPPGPGLRPPWSGMARRNLLPCCPSGLLGGRPGACGVPLGLRGSWWGVQAAVLRLLKIRGLGGESR
jgi:hypothetical protein